MDFKFDEDKKQEQQQTQEQIIDKEQQKNQNAQEQGQDQEQEKQKENVVVKRERHDIRRMKEFMQRAYRAETEKAVAEAQKQAYEKILEKLFTTNNIAGTIKPEDVLNNTQPNKENDLEKIIEQKIIQKMQAIQQTATPPENIVPETEIAEIFEDYDEALENADLIQIPTAVEDIIAYSPNKYLIAYYLAKNPDKATKLFNMPEKQAIKEIGRIEAEMESVYKEKKSKNKKATSAPPPITPPTNNSNINANYDKLSDSEWFRKKVLKRQ